MTSPHRPPQPIHVPGTSKGEEMGFQKEPGRGGENNKNYRTARDSTGINAKRRQPIHPNMPNIPPA